ncbi:hypothetical protein RFI_35542, partial [Reticulomyxa filosa]
FPYFNYLLALFYSTLGDSCVGCDQVPNSGKKVNPCGYCLNSTMDNWDTYGKDCRGTCHGGYVEDSCGKCLSPEDSDYNSCRYSQYSSSSSSSKGGSSVNVTIISVVVVVALLFVIGAATAVWKMYKRQRDMDQKWNKIVLDYQLMDNKGKHPKRKGMVEVPDEDPEVNLFYAMLQKGNFLNFKKDFILNTDKI